MTCVRGSVLSVPLCKLPRQALGHWSLFRAASNSVPWAGRSLMITLVEVKVHVVGDVGIGGHQEG